MRPTTFYLADRHKLAFFVKDARQGNVERAQNGVPVRHPDLLLQRNVDARPVAR